MTYLDTLPEDLIAGVTTQCIQPPGTMLSWFRAPGRGGSNEGREGETSPAKMRSKQVPDLNRQYQVTVEDDEDDLIESEVAVVPEALDVSPIDEPDPERKAQLDAVAKATVEANIQ